MDVAIVNDWGHVVHEIVRVVGNNGIMWPNDPVGDRWTDFETFGDWWTHFLILCAHNGSAASVSVMLDYRKISESVLVEYEKNYVTFLCSCEHAFQRATNVAVAALLLPYVRGFKRKTILAEAVSSGKERAVTTLLRCKADAKYTDWSGHTALHHAARFGRTRVVAQLLRFNAVADCRSLFGFTALDLAMARGHVKTADVLRRFAANGTLQRRDVCGTWKNS